MDDDQGDLFRAFGGETYDPDRDFERLNGQLLRVRDFMSDGRWHLLKEIAQECRGSEAAVSARLRDLRKPRYGARVVDREYLSNGLWRYRLRMEGEAADAVRELQPGPVDSGEISSDPR